MATKSSSSKSSGATYKSAGGQTFSSQAAANAANARVASLKSQGGTGKLTGSTSSSPTSSTPTTTTTKTTTPSSTAKTTTYIAPNGKVYQISNVNGQAAFVNQVGQTVTGSTADIISKINSGNPVGSAVTYGTGQGSGNVGTVNAKATPVVNANSNTVTNTAAKTTTPTTAIPVGQTMKTLIPGLNFGATAGTEEQQSARNADIAKKFSSMAGDLSGKTEQEKKDAVTEFLKTDLGLNVDTSNTNRQNTINKITGKVNSQQGIGELPTQPEKTQEEIDAGKNMETQSNEITNNQYTDLTDQVTNLRTYIKTIADPAMAKTIEDRIANINDAQGKISTAINLIDDSKQRIIRLQSNDALEGITKQYMAKGLTEEEARSQGQADMNKQIMNERQTLLQAQADTAALTKDMLTWVANAKDAIQVAKNSNIQYDVGLETTLTQLQNDIINNKYVQQKSAFDTYVGSTVMKAFNDMSAIEKQQLLKIADADTLDQNKLVAVTTLLGSVGSLLSTRSGAIYAAINGIKNGTMDYATALQTVVGNNATTKASTSNTTTTNTTTSDYSYS